MLADLRRHPHASAVLSGALSPAGRPSHAYLFTGPSGSGKADAARGLATALLSGDRAAPEPGVAARVGHGAHPDLTWVRPSSAAGILVADIADPVIMAATRTPFEASRRVFVIEDADQLNDQAANRLLKTLEEPPDFVHLVLLSARGSEVLPTIRSRCQIVRFEPLDEDTLVLRAQQAGAPAEQARAAARLALGDGATAAMLVSPAGVAMRHAAEGLARAIVADRLAAAPWLALLEPAKQAGEEASAEVLEGLAEDLELVSAKERSRVRRDREEVATRAQRRTRAQTLRQGLGLVALWLRDVACAAQGATDVVHHADRLAEVADDASRRAASGVWRAVVTVEETRASLALNVSEELALEAMAVRAARYVHA